jgi:CO/xanthine dehydrogenase Mo-binding subunit
VGSILATGVLRTEDPGFLTRRAVYTDDLVDERLAGAVHVTFVRSPVAHARITAIETSAAVAAPGVVAVLTAKDLDAPEQRPMFPMYPADMAQPLLARDVVRFVGEAVAVVLTEEHYQGEDAVELVSGEVGADGGAAPLRGRHGPHPAGAGRRDRTHQPVERAAVPAGRQAGARARGRLHCHGPHLPSSA